MKQSDRKAADGSSVPALLGSEISRDSVRMPCPAVKHHSNNFKKLQAQLRGSVGKAIADYAMIAEGDHVMV